MKEDDIRPQELFDRYLALARRDAERLLEGRARFEPVSCPACGSSSATPDFEKLGFTYSSCDACGSLFVTPRPTAEQILGFYRDSDSVRFWSTDFFRVTAEARRAKIFRPRALFISDLAKNHLPQGRRTLADIGAGYGIFLEEARDVGVFERITAIEPAPSLAEVCRGKGFPVVPKAAEDVGREDVVADVATAFEVLEHLHAPLPFLAAAKRFIRPGGILVFTTLTCTGFDIRALWSRSKSVHPPHHINLLSVQGLRRLVERAGLELMELSTPGQLDVDILRNALLDDPSIPVGRFERAMAMADEPVRAEFQRFLRDHHLSSHVRVVARVPEA